MKKQTQRHALKEVLFQGGEQQVSIVSLNSYLDHIWAEASSSFRKKIMNKNSHRRGKKEKKLYASIRYGVHVVLTYPTTVNHRAVLRAMLCAIL